MECRDTDTTTSTTSSKPVLLRIKRKRDEEPLNALLVEQLARESKRKRTYGDGGDGGGVIIPEVRSTISTPSVDDDVSASLQQHRVFRFAGTVSVLSAEDSTSSVELLEKVNMAKRSAMKSLERSSVNDGGEGGLKKQSTTSTSLRQGASSVKEASVQARYAIVNNRRNRMIGSMNQSHVHSISSNSSETMRTTFDMLEVARQDDVQASEYRKRRRQQEKTQRHAVEKADSMMCNLIPMVREYLSTTNGCSDKDGDAKRTLTDEQVNDMQCAVRDVSETPTNDLGNDDDEYVYDVYYEDNSRTNVMEEVLNDMIRVRATYCGNDLVGYNSDEPNSDAVSDDSNAEGYAYNSYPEDEDDSSYNDDVEDSDNDDDSMYGRGRRMVTNNHYWRPRTRIDNEDDDEYGDEIDQVYHGRGLDWEEYREHYGNNKIVDVDYGSDRD